MMPKFSILINSCDKYSDVWPMFFHIFKKTWIDQQPPIYLNTETKQFSCEEIKIKSLNLMPSKTANIPWGERLKDCLNRIDTDYVLMLLEDFYFESEINTLEIAKCVDYLDKHRDVVAFQFLQASKHRYDESAYCEFCGFKPRKRFSTFLMTAGPALWRKSDLLMLTKDSDDPWTWEYFGSYRTWFYGKKFYCWADVSQRIFDYDYLHGGAVHRGKWVGYKMRELTDKYAFELDYGEREVEEDWMSAEMQMPSHPIIKRLPTIMSNKLKTVVNICDGIRLGHFSRKQNRVVKR